MEDGIMKKSLFFAVALLALAACTREVAIDTHRGDMTITAKTETSADTKTVVEGGTHVYWEPGDEIKVFAGGKSGKFTTDISASSASATFNGTLGEDAWTEGMDLWAVYPYSKDAVFSDGTITTVLPSEQVARAGSFGKDMNLAIAHSTTSELQFYNVGGGACFSVTNKGIKAVTFKSINGESLAGKVQVTFEEGEPIIKRVIDGMDEVTVYAPDGEFLPGEFYYAVMLPQELAAGIVVSYKDALCSAGLTVEINSINRSYYGKMDQADHWFVFDGDYATPDLVDLGLSVMWGTFNLGASKPEEYGHYYAWGESVPKTDYDWSTYRWGLGFEDVDLFKYCSAPLYGWNEFTDNLVTLEPEDDAAHLILGKKWRMPTMEEWDELLDNCTRTKVWVEGVLGCRFTSIINGESIFLPAAGHMSNSSLNYPGSYGYYWSSDLFENRPNLAYGHIFDGNFLGVWSIDGYPRESGYSIRPVYGDPPVSVESISLDITEIEIPVDGSIQLTATILPENATFKSVTWTSSDESIARVSSTGVVTGVASGSAVITATTLDGGKTVTCQVTVKEIIPSVPVPEAVDLGLSIKWASFNLGASVPEEYGDYYAWGETEPKNDYYWSTYIYWNQDKGQLIKYITESSWGVVDNKTSLELSDDAAHVQLGGKWRMPTNKDWEELRNNCSWTWTTLNGVYGRMVVSNIPGYTDKWIFLPAAGSIVEHTILSNAGIQGFYWASSINANFSIYAWGVGFESDIVQPGTSFRYAGVSVRPVCD